MAFAQGGNTDIQSVYGLKVPANVPVDGFWSVRAYNAEGVFAPNVLNA